MGWPRWRLLTHRLAVTALIRAGFAFSERAFAADLIRKGEAGRDVMLPVSMRGLAPAFEHPGREQ